MKTILENDEQYISGGWPEIIKKALLEEEGYAEEEIEDFNIETSLEGIYYMLLECGSYEDEEVDSCYITQNYSMKIGNKYLLETSGSSYRKDMSVCDEQWDEWVCITDIAKEKESKEKKKKDNAKENEKMWEDLFEGSTKEEILGWLKETKFPAALK